MKLVEELGELSQAILKNKDREEIDKEYGDVGISIYRLGTKLDLDLLEEMSNVVANDFRHFSDKDIHG